MNQRRATYMMPILRRHEGLTAADRREESRMWEELLAFLTLLGVLAANGPMFLAAGLVVAGGLLTRAMSIRVMHWEAHPAIDKVATGKKAEER